MIGYGLKKLARENGLKIAAGVAYGSLRGYAATLSEGDSVKQITLATKFPDPARLQWLQNQLDAVDLKRSYRVMKINWNASAVQIFFHDMPGTMKRIRLFIDWFFPLLDQTGAARCDVCSECGGRTAGGCWKLIGGTAYYFHSTCADKVIREIQTEEHQVRSLTGGSYLSGAAGAVLGALLGAVVWAAVMLLGYIAGIVGLLIGWLAGKGYDLLKGKQDKGKVAVLILAVVLGVLAGTAGAEYLSVALAIQSGELAEFAYGEIPELLFWLLRNDREYAGVMLGNVAMGLLFAGLGVFGMLKKTSREVSDTRILDLP